MDSEINKKGEYLPALCYIFLNEFNKKIMNINKLENIFIDELLILI